MNGVIDVATKGQTTLFKASEVLEQTMEAYRYARFAERDDFDLKRRSGQLLRDYDETLKAMIRCRLDSQLDEASQKEEECSRQLSEYDDNIGWMDGWKRYLKDAGTKFSEISDLPNFR